MLKRRGHAAAAILAACVSLLIACSGDAGTVETLGPTGASADDAVEVASTTIASADDDVEKLEMSDWAVRFCSIVQDFEDEMADLAASYGTSDGLSLEQRQAYTTLWSVDFLAATDRAMQAFEGFEGPSAVGAFQAALSLQFATLSAAVAEASVNIARATSVAEIEAEDARLNVAAEAASDQEEAENLPGDAVAALQSVTNCGAVT